MEQVQHRVCCPCVQVQVSGSTYSTVLKNLNSDTVYTVTVLPVYAAGEGQRMSENGKTCKHCTLHCCGYGPACTAVRKRQSPSRGKPVNGILWNGSGLYFPVPGIHCCVSRMNPEASAAGLLCRAVRTALFQYIIQILSQPAAEPTQISQDINKCFSL